MPPRITAWIVVIGAPARSALKTVIFFCSPARSERSTILIHVKTVSGQLLSSGYPRNFWLSVISLTPALPSPAFF
jgi:hypothetical protein